MSSLFCCLCGAQVRMLVTDDTPISRRCFEKMPEAGPQLGVLTRQCIRKGDFVCEYVGEFMTVAQRDQVRAGQMTLETPPFFFSFHSIPKRFGTLPHSTLGV